jgi:hypothetical protein
LQKPLDPTKEIALEILNYLQRNPDAKDTVGGIREWWVREVKTKKTNSDVEDALHLLVSQNLIVETRRGGLAPFYRVNQKSSAVIVEILKRRDFS